MPAIFTSQFIKDTSTLIIDFNWFMSMTLLGADRGLQGNAKREIVRIVDYSITNVLQFKNLFDGSLGNPINVTKLKTHFDNVLLFMRNYIAWIEPALKEYKPDIYNHGFSNLKRKYLDYLTKYSL